MSKAGSNEREFGLRVGLQRFNGSELFQAPNLLFKKTPFEKTPVTTTVWMESEISVSYIREII
ncbi:MAG: hypothetical protein GY765_10850 [bacterium]|nr:hypothetical protein [bacterium]